MSHLAVDRIILSAELATAFAVTGWIIVAAGRRWVRSRVRPSGVEMENVRAVSTIIYFWSANCAQCKPQEAEIEKARSALGRAGHAVDLKKHDALADSEAARSMHVLTVPTTVIVDRGGKVTAWNPGLTSAKRIVDQVRSADSP